ncbi:sugar transferase [Ferrimonas balearica]|uniref:sugar transferase n=1 Tax=Ferrimonas balearica TaxID=44012 RepID=UPI001F15B9B3|nr:sugar transferase [Ferrimonas balearica]MBY6096285.1 sugar transferase [Ferrimonas balearica]
MSQIVSRSISALFPKQRWSRTLELTAAWLMLLCALPMGLVFALIIKLQDGGPVFYRGTRLGKNRKLFTLYKFRTLVPNAEAIIGANLLKPSQQLETPFGKFLRDTHLDELPQVLCVIKGDMALIGPRPERPAVYETMCREIPFYDHRFRVAPGMLGYSQLFTPHGTDKRIRSFIDNVYINRRRLHSDLLFFFQASLVLTQRLVRHCWRLLKITGGRVMFGQQWSERRHTRRHKPRYAKVHIQCQPPVQGHIVNITYDAMLIALSHPLENADTELELVLRTHFIRKARFRTKLCRVRGTVISARSTPEEPHCYLVRIAEATPLNRYFLSKYFMS